MTKQQLINYLQKMRTIAEDTADVRICVDNLLYDIENISTSINVGTNKPDIIVYVKDK